MGTEPRVYGNYNYQPPVYMDIGTVQTPYGMLVGPGSRVAAYVRSTGPQDTDPQPFRNRLVATLSEGLKQCRPGMGDIVYVLPGHTENVVDNTFLNNLVNGTRIIGLGAPDQDDGPTFTWTAVGATWGVSKKNVTVSGLRLLMDGANDIATGIGVTAAGFKLVNCFIRLGTGATNDVSSAVTVTATGENATIACNDFLGLGASTATAITVVGAPSRVRIAGNSIFGSPSGATAGLISVSGAATDLEITNNLISNKLATGTAGIRLADVAATGMVVGNRISILAAGTASAQGVSIAGTAALLVRCFDNLVSDEAGRTGILSPVAAT